MEFRKRNILTVTHQGLYHFFSGIGDHISCAEDISYEVLVGEPIIKIPRSKGKHLQFSTL